MAQLPKTTQTNNAQVLRDEVVPSGNTAARVYQLLKDLIDSAIFFDDPRMTGVWVDCGAWNGSTNLFPTAGGTGAAGAIKKGNTFENTTDTTTLFGPDGGIINAGATIRALVDTPGQTLANWRITY